MGVTVLPLQLTYCCADTVTTRGKKRKTKAETNNNMTKVRAIYNSNIFFTCVSFLFFSNNLSVHLLKNTVFYVKNCETNSLMITWGVA